jgi:hypothetical protein
MWQAEIIVLILLDFNNRCKTSLYWNPIVNQVPIKRESVK